VQFVAALVIGLPHGDGKSSSNSYVYLYYLNLRFSRSSNNIGNKKTYLLQQFSIYYFLNMLKLVKVTIDIFPFCFHLPSATRSQNCDLVSKLIQHGELCCPFDLLPQLFIPELCMCNCYIINCLISNLLGAAIVHHRQSTHGLRMWKRRPNKISVLDFMFRELVSGC
jgi:hypothetical protein